MFLSEFIQEDYGLVAICVFVSARPMHNMCGGAVARLQHLEEVFERAGAATARTFVRSPILQGKGGARVCSGITRSQSGLLPNPNNPMPTAASTSLRNSLEIVPQTFAIYYGNKFPP